MGAEVAGLTPRVQVALVQSKHNRPQARPLVDLPEHVGNQDVLVRGGGRAVYQPEHHIGVGEGLLRNGHHVLAQFVERLVNPRCIEEENLRVGLGHNAEDGVARRLGLGGHDGQFLAQQTVEQRGFAHVGPPNHGHIAAAMVGRQGIGQFGGCEIFRERVFGCVHAAILGQAGGMVKWSDRPAQYGR